MKPVAMVKNCWLLCRMLKLGVGVGVTVGSGWTNAPEHVPSYDAPLRVTVHGAPFSNTEFAVIAGEVAA